MSETFNSENNPQTSGASTGGFPTKPVIVEKNENRLTIEISQPEFEVKVSGFDKHRDLLVRTQLQLLDSEVAS